MEITEGAGRNGSRKRHRKERATRRPARIAYTIPQLTKIAGVGKTKLYREIAAGCLVASKCGRRTVVTRANAKAWLREMPTVRSSRRRREDRRPR